MLKNLHVYLTKWEEMTRKPEFLFSFHLSSAVLPPLVLNEAVNEFLHCLGYGMAAGALCLPGGCCLPWEEGEAWFLTH